MAAPRRMRKHHTCATIVHTLKSHQSRMLRRIAHLLHGLYFKTTRTCPKPFSTLIISYATYARRLCKAPHLLRSSCSGRLSLSRIGPGLGFTQARASQSASGFYLGHQTRPTTLCRRWAVSNSLSPSLSSFPPFIYPPIDRYRSLSYM